MSDSDTFETLGFSAEEDSSVGSGAQLTHDVSELSDEGWGGPPALPRKPQESLAAKRVKGTMSGICAAITVLGNLVIPIAIIILHNMLWNLGVNHEFKEVNFGSEFPGFWRGLGAAWKGLPYLFVFTLGLSGFAALVAFASLGFATGKISYNFIYKALTAYVDKIRKCSNCREILLTVLWTILKALFMLLFVMPAQFGYNALFNTASALSDCLGMLTGWNLGKVGANISAAHGMFVVLATLSPSSFWNSEFSWQLTQILQHASPCCERKAKKQLKRVINDKRMLLATGASESQLKESLDELDKMRADGDKRYYEKFMAMEPVSSGCSIVGMFAGYLVPVLTLIPALLIEIPFFLQIVTFFTISLPLQLPLWAACIIAGVGGGIDLLLMHDVLSRIMYSFCRKFDEPCCTNPLRALVKWITAIFVPVAIFYINQQGLDESPLAAVVKNVVFKYVAPFFLSGIVACLAVDGNVGPAITGDQLARLGEHVEFMRELVDEMSENGAGILLPERGVFAERAAVELDDGAGPRRCDYELL